MEEDKMMNSTVPKSTCLLNSDKSAHVVKIHVRPQQQPPSIRISVNGSDSISSPIVEKSQSSQSTNPNSDRTGFFFYNCGVMSSGQMSPSETLDSGTGSDLDGTPPPQPKKSSAVTVTIIGGSSSSSNSGSTSGGASSLTDSDETDSNISCDSLTSGSTSALPISSSALPSTLLHDIRLRATANGGVNLVRPYEERQEVLNRIDSQTETPNADGFYNFHLNERICDTNPATSLDQSAKVVLSTGEEETFAGYKDLLNSDGVACTIRSAKGTVRGVKNRVRAGIATFLQINSTVKSYKEKDAGKVVVYTTTMGILRETYQACMKVKQILRTLMVKFEERDVFMSNDFQTEIRERMHSDTVLVPQVFIDGQHMGDAESIEKLNESGELRRILKPYKSLDVCNTCKVCGGYRLLPCQVCNGSKKSVHRNHFTTEFVALKCMNCDEVGLVKCTAC